MNLTMLLDMAAEAFGERVAVVAGDARLTYAELRNAARNAAALIKARGVEHVAYLDVNSPAAPMAIFAAAYAGVAYVPINYRLAADEINALVARVAPALLISSAAYAEKLTAHEGVEVIDRAAFMQAPEVAEAEGPEPADDPASVAIQLFTSGTTGTPKAAILRHENLMSYILGTVEFGAADEEAANLVTVPPYHIAGISAVLSSTYACRRMAYLENFDADEWVATCRREQVTNAFLVPTMLGRIIDALQASGEATLPSLRAIAYGGGKMPMSTIKKAMQLLPQVDFTNAYGLTETSSTICILTPDDHREAAASTDPAVQKRLGACGRATGAIELQIRDDDGKVLGADEAGYVFVRGGQVAGEYKSLGSQLDADGWFPTRDRGYVDADGYLFLDGRADDVIVRGGENISPGEIEDVLLTHPAVADAAVVAMPDEQWGEGVAAAVVLKPGQQASVDELQALVKGKLRSSRVPQAIRFKDELPYNDMGKVLRRVIKQEFAV